MEDEDRFDASTFVTPDELPFVEVAEALERPYLLTRRDAVLNRHFRRLTKTIGMRRNPDGARSGDNRRECCAIAISGASGSGKTRIVDRLLDRHPTLFGRPRSEVLIQVSMPSSATLGQWGRAILLATGLPVHGRMDENIVWQKVRERLENKGILIVRLDEFQHVTEAANRIQVPAILNALKALLISPSHPVGLIVSGLPQFVSSLTSDTQVRKRTGFLPLSSVSLPEDEAKFDKVFRSLTPIVGLSIDEEEKVRVLPRLLHAAGGQLGYAIELICGTLEFAHEAGASKLDMRHFADFYGFLTGNCDAYNVFRADDWATHDPTRRAVTEEVLATPAPVPAPKRRRK